jgi:predicted metalloprotease
MPRYNPNIRLDTSQIEDVRGRGGIGRMGGGMPIAVGGGTIGIIVMLLLALFGGGNILDQGGEQATSPGAYGQLDGQTAGDSTLAQRCQTGADAETNQDCRIVLFVNSIQGYWTSEFARRGARYQQADTRFFTGATQTACGPASAEVGPFYCPGDGMVFIDLGFMNQLQQRLGAKGEFAQAYIMAHEYGHHIQNLTGTLDTGSRDTGPQSQAVRVELQADCLAGVWAQHAAATGYLTLVEQDIPEALNAAAAVGDDRIQKASGGRVQPHKFTHGTAEQRQHWFTRGFQTGDMGACDTFSGTV